MRFLTKMPCQSNTSINETPQYSKKEKQFSQEKRGSSFQKTQPRKPHISPQTELKLSCIASLGNLWETVVTHWMETEWGTLRAVAHKSLRTLRNCSSTCTETGNKVVCSQKRKRGHINKPGTRVCERKPWRITNKIKDSKQLLLEKSKIYGLENSSTTAMHTYNLKA